MKHIPLGVTASLIAAGLVSCTSVERPGPIAASPLAATHEARRPSTAASLGAVLEELRATSPLLAASEARAAASSASADAKRAARRGELDTFAQVFQFDSDRLVNPISGPSGIAPNLFDDQQYGFGVEGQLPLDINHRIARGTQSAEAQSQAAQARTEALFLQLADRASNLYRGLQTVTGSRTALDAELAALEKHLTIAKKSVEVGRLEEVEMIRIRAARDAVVGRLAGLDGREASLRAGLSALLHGAPFTQATPPPTAPPEAPPPFTESLDMRPDLRALSSEVKSAAHAADAAAAAQDPDLALIGGLRWNDGFDAEGDTTAELGLKLTWPALDGGRRSALESAARHTTMAKRLELAGALDAASSDVIAAEANWQAASAGYTAALSGRDAAAEAARVQRERFSVGRLSSTDLLDAEARLAEAEDNLSRTLTAWWRASDALDLAHGQAPQGTPQQLP